MRCSQNFDFLGLKNLSPGQFWVRSGPAPTHVDIIEFFNFLCQLKNQTSGNKTVWLFYYFNFERSYDVLKSKSSYILLNKNINFSKNRTESNMENPTQFQWDKPCVSAHIRIAKVKLWWVGAHERKKGAFFCTVYFIQRKFF